MVEKRSPVRDQRLKPLNDAIGTYKPVLISTVVFSFVANVLLFTSPLYMMQVYDRVLSSRSGATLLMLTAIALLVMAIYAMIEFVRSRMLVRVGIEFDATLGNHLFDAAITSELVEPNGQASQSVRDMDTVREFLTGGGLITLCDAPWAPLFIGLGFMLHPLLGTVTLVGAIVLFCLALINEFLTRKQLKSAGEHSNAAANYVSATLRNKEAIHAMGMRGAIRDRWVSQHRQVVDWQAIASDRAGVILTLTKFIRMGLQTAVLGVGAWLAIQQQISPGAMMAASLLMGRALQPVEQSVSQWKGFSAARDAYDRIRELLLRTPLAERTMSLPTPKGAISAEKAFVAPPGTQKPTVKNVNFAIEPGEVLALIGPSGSGKTTLIRGLVGVWPTIGGVLRIDGSAIQHWESEELGKSIGYLPQDVELFAGTVAENIARFEQGDSNEIIKAAMLAGVHEMIQALPRGYETPIGMGGGSLSGGQRQRVGLARAIYNTPSVIVLDEPNSNLDSSGEDALAEAIQRMKDVGSTVIVSTHKRNLLSLADKILVLQDGAVQAFGPRDQILRQFATPRPVAVAKTPGPTAIGTSEKIAQEAAG